MRTPSEGSSRSLMLSQRLERLLRNCPKLLQCQVLHTTCLSSRPPLPLTVAHVTASQSPFERQCMLDVEALTAAPRTQGSMGNSSLRDGDKHAAVPDVRVPAGSAAAHDLHWTVLTPIAM